MAKVMKCLRKSIKGAVSPSNSLENSLVNEYFTMAADSRHHLIQLEGCETGKSLSQYSHSWDWWSHLCLVSIMFFTTYYSNSKSYIQAFYPGWLSGYCTCKKTIHWSYYLNFNHFLLWCDHVWASKYTDDIVRLKTTNTDNLSFVLRQKRYL